MMKKPWLYIILPILLTTLLGVQNNNTDLNDEPTEAQLIGEWFFEESYDIKDIATSCEYIFAVGSYLKVIDISKPALPVEVASISLPRIPLSIDIVSDYAYILDKNGITIYDISSPTNPKQTETYDTHTKPLSIAYYKNYAYISLCKITGIDVIDITNPGLPKYVTFITSSGHLRSLEVSDDRLYAIDGSGVQTFDLSNPEQPTPTGYILDKSCLFDLAITNNMIGVLKYFSGGGEIDYDFYLYDISTPANIREIYRSGAYGYHIPPSFIIESFNNYIYFSKYQLEIFDTNDSLINSLHASYNFNSGIYNFHLTNDFIIKYEKNELYIYNQPYPKNDKIFDTGISVKYSTNYILFELTSCEENTFRIFDINGRIVYSSQGEMEIKFSGFKGIYIYEVVWGNGERETGKIMRWR